MNLRHIADQIAHFAAALLILAIASVGTIWAGALAGLALGLIRETAEGVRRMTIASVVTQLCKRDSQIDLVFWTLGGAVAGWLAF
ncbi:MAG: hypothetical protein MUF47_08855 [Porphyrobacter sp.]|jgi:hypothetical protein|nr:hypothetical protein [Porphyrobacter sp.]